jgi:hypothetical protein
VRQVSIKVEAKVELFMLEAVKAHRVVRRGGSHIAYKIDSQIAVRLPILRTGNALHPERSSGAYFCYKQTLWPLVRKRTISTERPPLVGEI